MKSLKTTWTGIRPLLVHNGQMVDPLNEYSKALKEVSGKRKKTDADHEEMGRIEFMGGLYYYEDSGPYMPSDCIEACVKSGAKKSRIGKDIDAALFVSEDVVPIEYTGPRDPAAMWKDPRFVLRKPAKVGTAKIMRTRPMFPTGWKITFTVEYDETILNEAAVAKSMIDAGALCGLCDWRPKFGRFTVEAHK